MTEAEAHARYATLKFERRLRHGAALIIIILLSMGLWVAIWSAVAWVAS